MQIRLTSFIAIVVLMSAACSSDDDPGTCTPLGAISIGAIGTVGEPLVDFADCYAGANPPVSLDGERTATATETTIVFDDPGLEATIDADCRLSIQYTFDTMLSDNTPAVGTSVFAADPDPEAPGTWLNDAVGSTVFEWDDGIDTAVCGNAIDDVYIVVQAR